MKLRGLAAISLFLLAGCNAETSTVQMALSDPVAMALMCVSTQGDSLTPVPVGECDYSAGDLFYSYVANGPTGDIAIVNMWTGQSVDNDAMIPGYTRLYVGTYLSDIAANPKAPMLYVADSGEEQLHGLAAGSLEVTHVALPAPAERVLVWQDGTFVLASLPAALQLAKVALNEDGALGDVTTFDVPGIPYSLAAVDDSTLLLGYIDQQFVSLLDKETLTEVVRLPLVPACSDHVDNDGDGLADSQDPGCLDPFDFDETDTVLCPTEEGAEAVEGCVDPATLPECADGEDNDGDGLADMADPGCLNRKDHAESSDAPVCSDGLDNDGDGATDYPDDKQCASAEGTAEAPVPLDEGLKPACSDGYDNDGDGLVDTDDPQCADGNGAWESIPYPCADGLDNDGDGLTDLNDPDCFGAGGATESGYPSAMPEIAVDDDGRFAYVTHHGIAQVIVLDLESQSMVPVNSVTDTLDRKIRALKNKWGIEFGSAPTGVAFQKVDDGLLAYVADESGLLSRVRVLREAQPLHQVEEEALDEGEYRQSTASKPRLYVDDEEVQLGYSSPVGYPNFGPLLVERVTPDSDERVYYGIRFTADRRAQRSETWYVEYEGNLPGTGSAKALVRSDSIVQIAGADLCSLGALPGDLFCLVAPSESGCSDFVADDEYCYVTTEMHSDIVTIDPKHGDHYVLAEEDGEDSTLEKAPQLNPSCFAGTVTFRIRPAGAYLVTGSRSGFLHSVVSTPEGCAADPSGDPQFTGRAREAGLLATPAMCPITNDTDGIELNTFQNPVLSFNIFPACDITPDGEVSILTPARGTLWSFSVTSGFLSEVIQVGYLPVDLQMVVETLRLYVLDLASRAIKSIDLDDFSVLSSYY